MFCRNCGHPLESGISFCGECGAQAAQPPQQTPVADNPKSKLPMIIGIGAAVLILFVAVVLALVWTGGRSSGSQDPEHAAARFLESYQRQDNDALFRIMHPAMKSHVEERQAVMHMDENYFAPMPILKSFEILEAEILTGYDFEDMLSYVDSISQRYTEADASQVDNIAFVYANCTFDDDGDEYTWEIEITVVEVDGNWYFFDMY